MRPWARLVVVLLLLGAAGCDWVDLKVPLPSMKELSELNIIQAGKQPAWQSPLLQKHHLVGRIWRPAEGRFVTEAYLNGELLRSAYILLGEKHDNPDHQLLQARLIHELTDQGRRPSVIWEMITETKQPILDQFRFEYSRDAAALGVALSWDVSGWPDWRFYQPVAAAAMAENLAMYAAGLPKPVVRALAKGRPSFKFAKRRRILGLHMPMPANLRARSVEQLYKGHCELMSRAALVPLFNVQRARDAVFAEHMLTSGARDGAILIAGNGHVRNDIAVPLFLTRHQPGVTVTSVAFVEVEDGVLDPVEYGEFFSAPVLPFDYVWFTPRADTTDHCAQLRKKWDKPAKPKVEAAKPVKQIRRMEPREVVKPAPTAPVMPKLAKPDVTKSELVKPANGKSDGKSDGKSIAAPVISEPRDAVPSAPKAGDAQDVD
ncbi:MAG: ChaN family lipoprotein [Alphaproteobacteria bacterium]